MNDKSNKNNDNWQMLLDGQLVSKKQLVKAWRFYQKYQLTGGETECPLCGCNLDYNEKFCCKECVEILPIEEECVEHNRGVCRDCCEECQKQKSYEDSVNARIDKVRGK